MRRGAHRSPHGAVAGLGGVLLAAEVQVLVEHHLLLHAEQPDVPGHRGREKAERHPPEDDGVLDGEEKEDLAPVLPVGEFAEEGDPGTLGDEDDDGHVGQHRQHAEDIERRIPRLVVRRGHGERTAVKEHEFLLVEEALQKAADKRKDRNPRARHHEKRRVSIKDQDFVNVLVHVVRLLFALFFCAGQVRHDRQGVGEERCVERSAFLEVPVPHFDVWQAELHEVLQCQAHDHENG
mmetsp:Transcript_49013/g.137197  ORF Transcript_49013/g.137197 Transcript_49013/m.137197 type:complete len:236 (+) Transcript_49013:210-917(+)